MKPFFHKILGVLILSDEEIKRLCHYIIQESFVKKNMNQEEAVMCVAPLMKVLLPHSHLGHHQRARPIPGRLSPRPHIPRPFRLAPDFLPDNKQAGQRPHAVCPKSGANSSVQGTFRT